MLDQLGETVRKLYEVANVAMYGKVAYERRYWKIQEKLSDLQSKAKRIGALTNEYLNGSDLDEGVREKIDGLVAEYDNSRKKLDKAVRNLGRDYGMDEFNADFLEKYIGYANSTVLNCKSLLPEKKEAGK